jgi:polyphosphate glucokinase
VARKKQRGTDSTRTPAGEVLGVDVGGSGIKAAVVNVETGELVSERLRLETPRPATPKDVAAVTAELVSQFKWKEPVGIGFPAAVVQGVVRTAANIDKKWIGTDAAALFGKATGCASFVLNDADAAGVAEMHFGAGRDHAGVVLMITIGTGLGTAFFVNGHLLPNTELGHLLLGEGLEAEHYASDAVRKKEDLGWKKWGRRFNRYLETMEALFWPELIILGGGASKKFDKFRDEITVEAEVVPAASLNQAGIVGAAVFAGRGNLYA